MKAESICHSWGPRILKVGGPPLTPTIVSEQRRWSTKPSEIVATEAPDEQWRRWQRKQQGVKGKTHGISTKRRITGNPKKILV